MTLLIHETHTGEMNNGWKELTGRVASCSICFLIRSFGSSSSWRCDYISANDD